MKRWALLVAGLYFLILAALLLPLDMVAFASPLKEAAKGYSEGATWLWLLVMFLGQAALLVVPVKLTRGRPVSRRGVLPVILTSGLMIGMLVAAGIGALWEFAFPKDGGAAGQWLILAGMLLTWLTWSVIFWRQSRTQAAEDVVSRQCRKLLKGSILELLVAVPTHIAVRHRNECCAGMLTFVGLVTGLSVMLFSFGPAVFFLFVARWKRLHPGEQS